MLIDIDNFMHFVRCHSSTWSEIKLIVKKGTIDYEIKKNFDNFNEKK